MKSCNLRVFGSIKNYQKKKDNFCVNMNDMIYVNNCLDFYKIDAYLSFSREFFNFYSMESPEFRFSSN